ncbi:MULTISPECIES: restriction endonuclease subunit S [unclassified Bradyrhizobium]|uniref:restriction endonuclease subunit S n=1 Tax=unclassified Bradyrhizobium TaxID=2631580 RepID=UPI002916CB1F|nr:MULTISPECIES: restriction endonuclease subunit S [unclassified Bradyrhizobium]
MAGEWTETTFAELVGGPQNIIGGPFGSNLTQADYTIHGVPVIRGSNMGQMGRFIAGDFAYVSDQKASTLASNQVMPGDIVVTQRGTMGQVSIVPQGRAEKFIVSQSQMGVRVEASDPMFVYYLLTSKLFSDYLEGATIQTGVPHINMGILRSWRVAAPPKRSQELIAAVLSSLDDKIELNRRTAVTLQEMAQALFKSWFVSFDPVRAKAEGRPTGLPDTTAALFPARFCDGGLPEGWQEAPFGEVFDIRNGNTPSTEDHRYWGGDHQWATPRDLSPLASPVLLNTDRTLSDQGLAVVNSGLLPVGSVLLSTRAPIGYLAFATRPVAINQGMAGIVRKSVSPTYAWLWCDTNIDMFRAVAGGSTFPEISKGTLRRLPMVIPTGSISEAFAACVDPIVERLIELASESDRLATVRDTLLPRLISGELRIKDVDAKGEAA